MQLSDQALERACAHRLLGYWQHLAELAIAGQRGATWGMAFTFANGCLSAAGFTGTLGPAGLLAWALFALPTGCATAWHFRRHQQLGRALPDIRALQPILDEMRRRAGQHTGQPGEALRGP